MRSGTHPVGRNKLRESGEEGENLPRPGALAPLREPLFRALWSANFLSNIGGMVQAIGAAWMMTAMTGGDPRLVSLVQTAAALPVVLLSIIAGVLADIFDRRLIMLIGQAMAIAGAAALVALAYCGLATPALLLIATFLIGSGYAVTNPGWYASFREQVSPQLLEPAVMLNALGYNLARSIGPALGGVIIAIGGVISAFAVNTLSYIPLFAAIWLWRPPVAPRTIPPERFLPATLAGPRFVAHARTPFAAVVRSLTFGLIGASIWALMPLVARDILHGGPTMLGLLLLSFGIGAATGTIVRVRLNLDRAMTLMACTIGYGMSAILLGASHSAGLSLLACFLAGNFWVAALSGLNVALQIHSPRWVSARAMALLQVALFLGMGLGSALWGALAGQIGIGGSLIASGVTMLASLAMAKVAPIIAERVPDLTPFYAEPPIITGDWRAGPVQTRIVYRLAEPASDPETKLDDMMHELGRIRRRDGADKWAVKRGDGCWIETFETQCLLDDVHRRCRMTVSDILLFDHLRGMNAEMEIERSIAGMPL